jgi:hypothetical protein
MSRTCWIIGGLTPLLALTIARSGLLPGFPSDGLLWRVMPFSIGS